MKKYLVFLIMMVTILNISFINGYSGSGNQFDESNIINDTNATNAKYLNKSNPVNVLDFGAISKEVAGSDFDSTGSFEDALSHLEDDDYLYIPEGTYLISDFEIFNVNDLVVVGENPDNTIVVKIDESSIDGQIQYKDNLIFLNIQWINFGRFGFYECNDIVFANCRFYDFSLMGIQIQFSDNVEITNCKFKNIGWHISKPESTGGAIVLQGNSKKDTSNILIDENYFEETKGHGAVFIYGHINDFDIENNIFKNTAYGAIHHWELVSNSNNKINNNKIYGSGLGTVSSKDSEGAATGVGCSAIYCHGDADRVVVTNNLIMESVENGIEGKYKEIAYNTIINTGVDSNRPTPSLEGIWSSYEDAYIHDNVIEGAAKHGILYSGSESIKDYRIIDNQISVKSGSSIFLNSTSESNEFENVIIEDNQLSNDIMIIGNSSDTILPIVDEANIIDD